MMHQTGDHPRLRGEKISGHIAYTPHSGSPPLTRGKAFPLMSAFAFVRITPAYAGKRPPARRSSLSDRDHPRLRGEKGRTASVKIRSLGSPPLTRGKERNVPAQRHRRRITPAYAGKSTIRKQKRLRNADHPRLRGEKLLDH